MILDYEKNVTSDPKNKLVVLTGVSGSGKDFFIERLQEDNPEITQRLNVVNFGEVLFRRIKGGKPELRSRDGLKFDVSNDVIKAAVSEIVGELLTQKPSIVNTHIAYKQLGSIQINPDICKILNPDTYVYIWADPELVFKRRRGSIRFRERALEEPEEIALHQQIAFDATRAIALAYGSEFRSIVNREDNLQSNVALLQEVILRIL